MRQIMVGRMTECEYDMGVTRAFFQKDSDSSQLLDVSQQESHSSHTEEN